MPTTFTSHLLHCSLKSHCFGSELVLQFSRGLFFIFISEFSNACYIHLPSCPPLFLTNSLFWIGTSTAVLERACICFCILVNIRVSLFGLQVSCCKHWLDLQQQIWNEILSTDYVLPVAFNLERIPRLVVHLPLLYRSMNSVHLRLFALMPQLMQNKQTQWLESASETSWLQIQRSEFDSRRYQIFGQVVVLERGPLSLVSTTEEPLQRKSSGSGLKNRHYGRRNPPRWPRDTLCLQKLAAAYELIEILNYCVWKSKCLCILFCFAVTESSFREANIFYGWSVRCPFFIKIDGSLESCIGSSHEPLKFCLYSPHSLKICFNITILRQLRGILFSDAVQKCYIQFSSPLLHNNHIFPPEDGHKTETCSGY
jgi:hypothetical protein